MTFAKIDAAAMDADRLSPFTIVRTGRPKSFARLPSMSARSGRTSSLSIARCMARNVACKILISSISRSEAIAIPVAHGVLRDHVIELTPLFVGQLFGVVEPVDDEPCREYYRRRTHRPRQRPAPRFIDAADRLVSFRERFSLIDP